jgi:arginase
MIFREHFDEALAELRGRVEDVCLYIDLDILDPDFASGVGYPVPGGMSIGELTSMIKGIANAFNLPAAAVAGYHPEDGQEGRTLEAELQVREALIRAANKKEAR